MCPKLRLKRVLKLDGTLAVKMWSDVWFGITQPQTDPIDDMNGCADDAILSERGRY